MKLGISYVVFDGEELLPFAISSIRSEVDFISIIYQTVSYFGNPANENLVPNLKKCDVELIEFKNINQCRDLREMKINELLMRNMGLELSKQAGCTHHISADVDEFYTKEQLAYAKSQMDGYDCSVVHLENYYKEPTWRIWPSQKHKVSLIQPVSSVFSMDCKLPFPSSVTYLLAANGND